MGVGEDTLSRSVCIWDTKTQKKQHEKQRQELPAEKMACAKAQEKNQDFNFFGGGGGFEMCILKIRIQLIYKVVSISAVWHGD